MMIPESPCPSLFDDGSVGVGSEFIRASPGLESSRLPRYYGYGGVRASGGFPRAHGIGTVVLFARTNRCYESSSSKNTHQGSPVGLPPGPPEALPQGFPEDVPGTSTDCRGCRPARSTVMPDKYDVSGSWVDFITQFETVAELNSWDGEESSSPLVC